MAVADKLVNLKDLKAAYDTQYNIIVEEWSSSTTYNAGDYCIYNGNLWRCKLDLISGSNYTPSSGKTWANCTAMGQVKTAIEDIAQPYDFTKSYAKGDYISRNRKILKANKTTGDGDFDSGDWNELDDIANDLKTVIDAETAVPETVVGTSATFVTTKTNPIDMKVSLEATIPDTSGATPEDPVDITGITSDTIIVNDVPQVVNFANRVGKASWDVLSGEIIDEKPIIELTADMITGSGTLSDMKPLKFDVGIPIGADGIIACSHYIIYKKNTDTYPYIRWYANSGGNWWIYDPAISKNLTLQEAKDYISGLHVKLVLNPSTPVEYNETPQSITLEIGENTVSVNEGMMSLSYGVDVKTYVDNKVSAVEDELSEALEIAQDAADHGNDLQNDVDTINTNLYKYRTQTGTNIPNHDANAASTINWGFRLPPNDNNIKCKSITITPVFVSEDVGNYTATRWKNSSGNPVATGDTLTKVEQKTQAKGTSVTFDYLRPDEFVSIDLSIKFINASNGAVDVDFGFINPTSNEFKSFNGSMGGDIVLVTYKPIKDDSMPLFGKNITLIGDSITEKNGRASVNHGMWLERWTGCVIQNKGVGGTGFKRTAGSTYYKSRISSINEDVDIIGVAASFNDMIYTIGDADDTESDNTVCGYANGFFDALLTAFPTARIVCYSEGPWYNYKPGVSASDTFMEEMAKICANKGIVWDDGLYRGCALRPWMQENCNVYYLGEEGQYVGVVDNIHPNSADQKIIARYLQKLFEKVVE